MLILPRQVLPSGRAQLRTDLGITPRFVLLPGASRNDLVNGTPLTWGNDAIRIGNTAEFPGANGYIDYGADYPVSHNSHTLVSVHEIDVLTSGFSVHGSYATSGATRMNLFYSSDVNYNDISFGETGGGGTSANRQKFALPSSITRTGQKHNLVARRAGDGLHAIWVNGQRLTASNSNSFASVTGNNAIGNGSPSSTANDFNGRMWLYALFEGVLSDALCEEVSQNPAMLFQPRRIWVPGAEVGGGGSVSLTVPDAAHAHAVDSPTLTTATTLAVADASHGHAADAPTLSTGTALVVAESAHAHAVDAPTISVQSALTVAEALHGHAADNVTLEVAGATSLTVADALHPHAVDALALTSAHALIVADATHGHAVEGLTLTAASVLAIQEALHAHAADAITLDAGGGVALFLADALHAHTSDGVALTVAAWLVLGDATHGHATDSVVLTFNGPVILSAPPIGHGPAMTRRTSPQGQARRAALNNRTR